MSVWDQPMYFNTSVASGFHKTHGFVFVYQTKQLEHSALLQKTSTGIAVFLHMLFRVRHLISIL
jgi:hypothetical protein